MKHYLLAPMVDVDSNSIESWLTTKVGTLILVVIGLLIMSRARSRGATSANAESTFNLLLGVIIIGAAGVWFTFGEQIANTILS